MLHEDQDLKKEFQVERLALFSDAVFAIAITLLVIELKIPGSGHAHSDHDLFELMADEFVAKFIGFIVSFLVIAIYWVNHHMLFGFLEGYNKKLIWANLYFLFTIILMPFSSGFYSENWFSHLIIPVAFYSINICLSAFMLMRLWNIITNPANKLCNALPSRDKIRYHKTRSLVAPVVFLLSLLVAFFNTAWSYMIPLAIPLLMLGIRIYYRKRSPSVLQ